VAALQIDPRRATGYNCRRFLHYVSGDDAEGSDAMRCSQVALKTRENVPAQWNDTSAGMSDLKFTPGQTGLWIGEDHLWAQADDASDQCAIEVTCLDYGAYGSLAAYVWFDDEDLPSSGARLKLADGTLKTDVDGNYWELAPIPWDEDTAPHTHGQNYI